jgi:CBS domain-containing protein
MNIARILATKGAQVITIAPDRTIREALALLARHNIGALVVVDAAGAPVGILSERDVVRAAARDEDVFGAPVSALMTKELILGAPADDLPSVVRTMTERRIRHLPVIERGRLVGIVSIGDVVKAERDRFLGELDTLQTRLLEAHP